MYFIKHFVVLCRRVAFHVCLLQGFIEFPPSGSSYRSVFRALANEFNPDATAVDIIPSLDTFLYVLFL